MKTYGEKEWVIELLRFHIQKGKTQKSIYKRVLGAYRNALKQLFVEMQSGNEAAEDGAVQTPPLL